MTTLRLVLVDERGGASLTPRLVESLRAALQAEDGARIVTLEGGAGAFCAGLDPAALAAAEEPRFVGGRELLDGFADLLDRIERAPRPVIALVDGAVLGGGIGLAAAADFVLATPRATFSLPEALLGLIPAMVFPVLARRVGVPRARWLALGGSALSAEEALRIGLVDEIADDLTLALERRARRLLRMDPRALAEIKRLTAEHYRGPEHYRADAAERFHRLLGSAETRSRLVRFAAGESPWPEDDEHVTAPVIQVEIEPETGPNMAPEIPPAPQDPAVSAEGR